MCASLMEGVLFYLIKEAHFYPCSLQATSRCASRGLSPNQGPSGSSVVVKGHYFTSNGEANISWYDPTTNTTTYLSGVSVSAGGTFQFSFITPSNLIPGVHYEVQGNDVSSGDGGFAVFIAQA